jgi:uncharacterized Fe-S cluster protein YjdI/CDGSH-type Zn-finger protein
MATPPDDNRLGRAYAAPEVTVFYDRGRCRHYAECVRGLPQVFDPTRRPWIRADLADAQAVAEVVRRCPTGALHYRLLAEESEEPTHPTRITPDSRGPLLVRGDLVLDTSEGPLCETRAALCACGRTQNPPFCDGACGVNAGASGGTRDQAETSPRSVEPETGAGTSVRLTWVVGQVAGGWARWRDRRGGVDPTTAPEPRRQRRPRRRRPARS